MACHLSPYWGVFLLRRDSSMEECEGPRAAQALLIEMLITDIGEQGEKDKVGANHRREKRYLERRH